MEYEDLTYFLQYVGKDPSRLIFEDELTGIYNRRFLHNYLQFKISWESLDSGPVSLIMADVDRFKQINDNYGHSVGDQVLKWTAGILTDVADDQGLAIRYAGDEFMILLPGGDKIAALQLGEELLQRLRREQAELAEMELELSITLSIGIATAPDDAYNGKTLIQKADTALYQAKKTGRERIADAGQMDPQQVFPRTALHQLERVTMAGRRSQLAQVAQVLKKYAHRESQFLLIQGAGGMGKSEFLETVRRNLAFKKIWQVAVSGSNQQLFRPYSLAATILIALLNQHPDRGVGLVDSLSPRERAYLSQVLPQLQTDYTLEEDERTIREGIFTTLLHFIPRAVDYRPLILLIDDLHFGDYATLLLLRQLLVRREVPLFVCGTAPDSLQATGNREKMPLEQFLASYHEELPISTVVLTPLTADDFMDLIRGIFPQIEVPEGFGKLLVEITQGNPLFVGEILRKLVLDQKITLVGQQWVVQPLEEGYLPQSLEEIVSQKIAALDSESRNLLDQVSTYGENVSLSLLTGSSDKTEAAVLEFLDQAVAEGLVSSDFEMNDENIRFLSKRVVDVVYGSIGQERKKELHERIGSYQETLYQQRLLPSVATLTYHFQRSANLEKARSYQQSQELYNNKVFNLEEARGYAGEPLPEKMEVPPLDPDSLPLVRPLIRCLLTAVRNIKLYPPGSKAIVSAIRELKQNIDHILARNSRLLILQEKQKLLINAEAVDVSEFRPIAETFVKFLDGLELKSIAFSPPVGEQELTTMLGALGRANRKKVDRGFWERFAAEQQFRHIELKQVRYAKVKDDKTGDRSFDQGLDKEDLALIPEVLRCLLTSVSKMKLYPPESTVVTDAVGELFQALRAVLSRRPTLTLARVGSSLVVNGQKIDSTEFETLKEGYLRLLDSVKLKSLTFLERISAPELLKIILGFGRHGVGSSGSDFWRRFAREQTISGVLFDEKVYGILEEQLGGGPAQEEAAVEMAPVAFREVPTAEGAPFQGAAPSETEAIAPGEPADEPAAEEPTAALAELREHLLAGNEEECQAHIIRLFQDFPQRSPQGRAQVIQLSQSLLEDPGLAGYQDLLRLLSNSLLHAFTGEADPELLEEMAAALCQAASAFIQLDAYSQAARLLLTVRQRRRQLLQQGNLKPEEIFNLEGLPPEAQRLLLKDLQSAPGSRQQRAFNLLRVLGRGSTPLLIEVIKEQDDLRTRQAAARLLHELGPEAAALLQKELLLEGITDQRLRILEIIDQVTGDLRTELAYTLADEDPGVRRAAFHLAGRLKDRQVAELLLDYARHSESELALPAIRFLGKLKPEGAVEVLVSLLGSSKDRKRLIACCRALGQIADPAGLEPLARLVAPRRFLFLRRKPDHSLRAAAALALSRIPHPRAAEILAPLVDDLDPRVRELARTQPGKQ